MGCVVQRSNLISTMVPSGFIIIYANYNEVDNLGKLSNIMGLLPLYFTATFQWTLQEKKGNPLESYLVNNF